MASNITEKRKQFNQFNQLLSTDLQKVYEGTTELSMINLIFFLLYQTSLLRKLAFIYT